ncbi:MAG: hypothetical protein O3B96_01080 [bacterium]|nr:hypothetical protein [bacterium]
MSKLGILRTLFVALVFLYGALFFSMSIGATTVNTPDANANILFAKAIAETGLPLIEQPIDSEYNPILLPRSMTSINGVLVPVTFLGFPVLLGIAEAIVPGGAIAVTPILALLALFAFGALIETLFSNRSFGVLSALLLALHPAFWYYGMRVYMHNVPFVAFGIFSAWFLFARPVRAKDWLNDALAGFTFAVAAWIRTSELPWMLALLVIYIAYRLIKRKDWMGPAIMISSIVIAAIPMLGMQTTVYGSPFTLGYQVSPENPIVYDGYIDELAYLEDVADAPSGFLSRVLDPILPFGFSEKAVLRHSTQYLFFLYPWMSVLALVGIVFILIEKKARSMPQLKWLALALGIVSAWLIPVYGSWVFNDNPDPTLSTLGNSYVRYWLPIFILLTPLAAHGVERMANALSNEKQRLKVILVGLMVFACYIASASLIIYGPDGVGQTYGALTSFEEKRDRILELTEEDALLVVDSSDKYLFPHRAVRTPLRDSTTYLLIPKMIQERPVYYFGISLPEEDLAYLETDLVYPLQIDLVETIRDESLYKFYAP